MDPFLLLIISAIYAVCVVYLANHYRKKRINITLLLIAFFAFGSIFYFGYYLALTGVLPISSNWDIIFAALTIFGILLLIALVMIGIKELYLLPLLIVSIGLIHIYLVDWARSMTVYLIRYVSYLVTGVFLDNPWLIVFKDVSPTLVSLITTDPFIGVLNSLLDPIPPLIPQAYLTVLPFYMLGLSIPAIILFSFLTWKNRSGRSLGFAIGVIVADINLLLSASGDISASVMIVAAVFFALGIFGVFDKLVLKKEKSTKERSLKAKIK